MSPNTTELPLLCLWTYMASGQKPTLRHQGEIQAGREAYCSRWYLRKMGVNYDCLRGSQMSSWCAAAKKSKCVLFLGKPSSLEGRWFFRRCKSGALSWQEQFCPQQNVCKKERAVNKGGRGGC